MLYHATGSPVPAGCCVLTRFWVHYINKQIPEMERGNVVQPAYREIISDSVELCDTHVCFLHIQLIRTNVWIPNMHHVPPEAEFESSRSPEKSESWNSPNLYGCAVFPTWQYCLYSLVKWMYEIKRARLLSHALVHFVIARANLLTDHRISGLPLRAKYRHFRTSWEHYIWQSSKGFQFFFFELMVIKTWCWYFVKLLNCFVS